MSTLVTVCFLDYSHVSVGIWWHCMVLSRIFLMADDIEYFFSVPISHLSIFFGDTSIEIICQFLNWVAWLFIIELFSPYIVSP